jgi:hypothetical protein
VLNANTTVSGALQSGDCRISDVLSGGDSSLVDQYQFTLSASAEVTISMTSSSFDTFLRLTDANLGALSQDDDSGTGFNAEISTTLNAGTYFIFANSATNTEESGSYSLTLTTSGGSSGGGSNSGVPTKLTNGSVIELPVVGESLVGSDGITVTVPQSAVAVSINVTVVKPSGSGHITVFPCGVAEPEASNLNYLSGQVIANGAIAQPSSSGDICVFAFRDTDVIVDMAGWFTSGYIGATPKRLLDTRNGTGGRNTALVKDEVFSVPVAGEVLSTTGVNRSVPANASAVSLNVTVVRPSSSGHVTVWPCGQDKPLASNLNYKAGDIVANNVIAPIGSDGSVCLSSFANVDIIVDMAGWFENSGINGFVGAVPKRLVDTRVGTGP